MGKNKNKKKNIGNLEAGGSSDPQVQGQEVGIASGENKLSVDVKKDEFVKVEQEIKSVKSLSNQQSSDVENIDVQQKDLISYYPGRESVTKSGEIKKMQQISVNYLPLNIDALPNIIYQHSVTFNPERPKKFLLPAFRLMIESHFPTLIDKVAFDGAKSFYAMQKLPDQTFSALEVASPDGTGRNKEFEISIQFATEIDMRVIKNYIDYEGPTKIQQAIQAFDVVLKSAFNQQGLIRYKSSVFKIPELKIPLADNFELIIGLYQSFVMGERPLLNVDVS